MTSNRQTPAMPARQSEGGQVVPLRRQGERSIAISEMSDEALLAACGASETAALGALFDRHHGAVFRFISRLLRQEAAEVDDLVQTTFMEAWRSAKRYSGGGSVKSYLFGIAANLVRHHVRGARRRRDAYARISEPADAPAGPADVAMRAQQLGQLAAALENLSHDLRAAYVLCDLEDVPGIEAARILDVRPGTLWRRLHDARRALRDALDGGKP